MQINLVKEGGEILKSFFKFAAVKLAICLALYTLLNFLLREHLYISIAFVMRL